MTPEDYVTEELTPEEQERLNRRREKMRQMRLEKERTLKRRRLLMTGVPIVIAALLFVVFAARSAHSRSTSDAQDISVSQETETSAADVPETAGDETTADNTDQSVSGTEASEASGESEADTSPYAAEFQLHSAQMTDTTAAPPDEVNSTNVIFIDLESGDVLAERGSSERINPASMTKVLTLLVAAEHITDLDDTFTMTIEITDYSYSNDCSSVGFSVGEVITVRDMLYGTILPSGGDAAVALATYVAGSHEAFVELMNEKLEELGLSDTAHFTNCVGLYDADHYCTVYDMAMIMEAALDNELCREVLSEHTYTTSETAEHPEGITVSNWFLRRIEDKDTGGEVICAKTGFVAQSGSCAVSYGRDASGWEYVCATTGAHSSWRCIYDHVALYAAYAEPAETESVGGDSAGTSQAQAVSDDNGAYDFTVCFAGDINLDESWCTTQYMDSCENGIRDCISAELIDAMNAADIMVLNNEFTYSTRGAPLDGKAFPSMWRLTMTERCGRLKNCDTVCRTTPNNLSFASCFFAFNVVKSINDC